jgi:hypothetical protein
MPTIPKNVRRANSVSPLNRLRLRTRFDFRSRSWSLPAFETPREAAAALCFFSRHFSTGKVSLIYPSARNRDGLAARRAFQNKGDRSRAANPLHRPRQNF